MRDLFVDPLCRAEDLGLPIPPTPYGVSVCLPLWEHVIGYEEKDPAVVSKFQSGYPRFFVPPLVQGLMDLVEKECAGSGEKVLVFPREVHAQRGSDYVRKHAGVQARVLEWGPEKLGVLVFPKEVYDVARRFWRFCGELVSARQAEAAAGIGGSGSAVTFEEGEAAQRTIKERLAGITGQRPEDVFLFPSGMAANYAVHRMLTALLPGRKTVQLDFPYVDVLKLQEQFGSGAHFLPFNDEDDFERLREIVKGEPLAGIFAEVPSNPLMKCVDLRKVVEMLFVEEKDVPLIVDDTVATCVNIDAFLLADVVTTSLTKAFSGMGDVLAGCVIVNGDSPFHDDFTAFLQANADHSLWRGDAVALEVNSRDFVQRVKTMSRNSVALYEFLSEHPAVDKVYHSIADESGVYDHLQRADGGHGSLLSFVLKDRSKTPSVYDAMEFCKGPSLGTNYSLACPYTLLAHYDELEWAESCGVDRSLIRFSTGLEPEEVIIERMKRALELASA
ncbi:PLP-dependent transferase [Phragmitibacter flavus]|nr:PLP-dependent transferase [Phragmitibacter flavus]